MRKFLSMFLLLAVVACEERKIEGYIVYKEYIPEHMCHSDVKTVVEAGVTPVPVHVHHHVEQEARWILYIGNSYGTTKVDVTENCYNGFKVTDKVSVYGNYVELIQKGCR